MIKESELNGKVLFENIQAMMADPKKQAQMAANAKKAGVPDAADRLIKVMKDLLN